MKCKEIANNQDGIVFGKTGTDSLAELEAAILQNQMDIKLYYEYFG